MHTSLLLLGGNLGELRANFDLATQSLLEHSKLQARSGIYRSEAWGMENAPDFLNQAVIIQTELEAIQLLNLILKIEDEIGRVRNNVSGYQSRILDIDILLFNQDFIETEHLSIPHPRMHLRNFTLIPAVEIAGDWVHPLLNKDLRTLADECKDKLVVELDEV